ncbi:hypothetical protein [Solibacillus sp.]|uniref:hypothetical protein n=1 Tax=Solibacillus sp. TaxID=1909654 RepID=UPI00331507A2
MNIKQLNENFYTNKELVGDINHCVCTDCIFYAEQIMKNAALVKYLTSIGLNPRKADEVWCYMEAEGFKHYTVDFFKVYADKEETHTFGNAKVTIYININAVEEMPQYICVIDVVFKKEFN